MADNNTDSDKSGLEGLGALICWGLLAYGVYKIFTSSEGDSSRSFIPPKGDYKWVGKKKNCPTG